MKSKELYPSIFSRYALAYQRRLDQVMSRGEAHGRQRVIDLVDARAGMRVLDLACGPGSLTRRLAAQVAPDGEVVGVDLAAGMVDAARSASIPNARFEVMDIELLRFDDRSFDAAACGHGLQFVPDLDRALREARRVLRPRARLAASVPLPAHEQRPWALVQGVVDRWLPPSPIATDRTRTSQTVGDAKEFTRAALDAGFGEARVELIEEHVRWDSAEQLVSLFVNWWDCAARMEGMEPTRQEAFAKEAVDAVRSEFPGGIDTVGSNHVLLATV